MRLCRVSENRKGHGAELGGAASRCRGTGSPSGKSQRILQGFSRVGEDVLMFSSLD